VIYLNKLTASIVLACLIMSGMSTRAAAAPFSTTASTVMPQQTFFYGTYGSGDVIFTLTTNSHSSSCYGYWLRGTDSALKNELAALMISISAQSLLMVNGDDGTTWTGSSNHYCLVTSLTL
jgi:hypothetical protein